METQRCPNAQSQFSGKNLETGFHIANEALMARNIQSYFQLAKMIVTKVSDIETKNRKIILVADDEPLTFRLVEEYIEDANLPCDILPATTGLAAYNIAVSKAPDLIITDWLMPELNGLDLIRRLKTNPKTKDIPAILFTGALMPDEEFNKALEIGAIDCIRKPLDNMELIARIKTALALHDALKELRENEETLQTKNQFLNFLMDVAPNPIFFTDKNGEVIGCNLSFEKLVGKTKDQITGKSIHQLLPEKDLNKNTDFNLLQPGVAGRFEIEFSDHNDKCKNLLLLCMGLGNVSGEIIGSITDVTEIVQAKRNAVLSLEINLERLQTELDSKHQKIATQTELLIHSKNVKSNFLEAVSKLQPYLTNEGKAKFFFLLKQAHWELNDEIELNVERDFDQLHNGLYNLLEKNCPNITKNEKRLCAYLKMNHCASDIAKITNKSLNSINVAFARLRAKLQLPSSKDLKSFLLDMTDMTLQNESVNSVAS